MQIRSVALDSSRRWRLVSLVVLGGVAMVACARHAPPDLYVDRAVWFFPNGGCSDSSARWLPPSRPSDTLSLAFVRSRPPFLGAWIARRVPGGFAGGPYPGHDTLASILYLRDPLQKHAALAALDSIAPAAERYGGMSPEHWPRTDTVVVQPARWDLAELFDWFEYLKPHASDSKDIGITGWGFDLRGNRLVFSVAADSNFAALAAWLEGRTVPCHLVAMRIMGPVQLARISAQAQ